MILPKDISFIFDQLDDSDIFYWIDAGSLLKGGREHSLLTSSDIDIAIHADQVDNVLIFLEKIKNKGYKVQFNGGYPMLEDLITIFLPYSINKINSLDIYIYHKYKSYYIRRSYHKPIKNSKSKYLFFLSKKIINLDFVDRYKFSKYYSKSVKKMHILISKAIFFLYEKTGRTFWYMIPSSYFSEFDSMKIHSRYFNIPKLYREYLGFRYGANWRVPIERNKWIQTCVEGNGVLHSKKLTDLSRVKKYWILK